MTEIPALEGKKPVPMSRLSGRGPAAVGVNLEGLLREGEPRPAIAETRLAGGE